MFEFNSMVTLSLVFYHRFVSIPIQAEQNVNKHAKYSTALSVESIQEGQSTLAALRTVLKSFKPILVSKHSDSHTQLKYDLWQ